MLCTESMMLEQRLRWSKKYGHNILSAEWLKRGGCLCESHTKGSGNVPWSLNDLSLCNIFNLNFIASFHKSCSFSFSMLPFFSISPLNFRTAIEPGAYSGWEQHVDFSRKFGVHIIWSRIKVNYNNTIGAWWWRWRWKETARVSQNKLQFKLQLHCYHQVWIIIIIFWMCVQESECKTRVSKNKNKIKIESEIMKMIKIK